MVEIVWHTHACCEDEISNLLYELGSFESRRGSKREWDIVFVCLFVRCLVIGSGIELLPS